MAFHKSRRAQATILLHAQPSPLEYGLVLTDETGRVTRFVEKPSWGQVVTDRVNTGIYLLSPGVLDRVPSGQPCDFGRDLFPRLLAEGAALYACPGAGYWCDMGDCEAYLTCVADALEGKVGLDLGLPQRGPGLWSAQPLPEGVTLSSPCWIGQEVRLAPGCQLGPGTVLERGTTIGRDSRIQNSVLLPGAQVGERATLSGAILCRDAQVQRGAVLRSGTVLGERALVQPGAVLLEGVRLWPGQTAPRNGHLSHSLPTAAQRGTVRFGDGGVICGRLGVDLGPEALLAIGSALGAAGKVGLGRWGGAGARMLAQAAASGISAAGGSVLTHDLNCGAQAAWLAQRHRLDASLFVEQEGERVFLHFFDQDGLPPQRAQERRLEHALLQGEYPRVGAGQLGELGHIQTSVSDYAADAVERGRLHRLALHTLTVAVPGNSPAELGMRRCLSQLGCTVLDHWERGVPAFGAEHGGFYLTAQDERGALLEPEQLLTLVCLIELENGRGRVAVPDGASAAVDLLAAGLGGQVLRLGRDGQPARQLYAALPWLRDAAFAAVRICARMAFTGERLEKLMAKTPRFSARRREVPLSADRGRVMRRLAQAYGRDMSGEGLRIHADNGWVYLVPLARRAALRVVAESPDMELAAELCDLYAARCTRADQAQFRQDAQERGKK
jgi:mannose-1-phosphate guanylyltransferase/phosphomannomutase